METYSSLAVIKKFQEMGLSLFTLSDFGRLFSIENKNTLYKKIQRLERKGLIKKLIKGKYFFLLNKPNDFLIANFLYQPSYISLESALSFYGIITGFSYQITSITVKKPKTISLENKEYQYSRLTRELFFGFEKKEDFLIAEKEKALFDYLYFAYKGLRTLDSDEFDLSEINKKRLAFYIEKIKNKSFLKFIKKYHYDY